MHSVEQLRQDLPECSKNIRRSRRFSKAAVIATGPGASRSLLVTVASMSVDQDYHLVHVVEVGPREVEGTELRFDHLELRPERWNRLTKLIRSFLAGDGDDHLIEVAAGRA